MQNRRHGNKKEGRAKGKKKVSKSNHSNYRPISLTSVICNILETLIRDKVVKFLEENGLINNSQFGFVRRDHV